LKWGRRTKKFEKPCFKVFKAAKGKQHVLRTIVPVPRCSELVWHMVQ